MPRNKTKLEQNPGGSRGYYQTPKGVTKEVFLGHKKDVSVNPKTKQATYAGKGKAREVKAVREVKGPDMQKRGRWKPNVNATTYDPRNVNTWHPDKPGITSKLKSRPGTIASRKVKTPTKINKRK